MSSFKLKLTLRDSKTSDPVYYKQDGKRFGETTAEERTLKFSTSVKYQIKIAVPSSAPSLRNLIIEHAELTPDKVNDNDRDVTYFFSWITNGFSKTKKGARVTIPFTFVFDSMDVSYKMQTKFYEFGNTQHLTWGHAVNVIEMVCSQESTSTDSAGSSPLQVNFL